MQSNVESLRTLFKRIYGAAGGQAQFVFQNDDNQEYLTHALIQSVLYNTGQDCVISYSRAHCLNDGTNATPMSLDDFSGWVQTNPFNTKNPSTRVDIQSATYNFYDCVTGTNTYHKPFFAAYKAQFDKAIEILSANNPDLYELDLPQEVKDALRGLQFPIIKPYTFDEINAITEEEDFVRNMNRLRLNKLNLDTNAVLQSGKSWLITLLSPEQIQALTQRQIQALGENEEFNTKEKVLKLSEENPYLIKLLSLEQIKALEPVQIKALKPVQIKALEPVQIKVLKPVQIKALTTAQIKSLTREQIKSLNHFQISALTEIQISALTEIQIQTLERLQIKALNHFQISALTEIQIKALLPLQIKSLQLWQIKSLQLWQIQVLDRWQIQALDRWQIQALTAKQIQALETLQIKALDRWQIKALLPAQIQALQLLQIWALTEVQIGALSTDQFSCLDRWQIQALTEVQISALSPDQLSWLTEVQINALSPGQLSWLTEVQIKALSQDQVSLLIEDQREALITNTLVQSYNSSDKSLEGFKKELGAYDVLRAIKDQDTQRAFLAMKFISRGNELKADNVKKLESSKTWSEFMGKLVTDLLNLFRTEQKQSMGAAKGNFQSLVRLQKKIAFARAAKQIIIT